MKIIPEDKIIPAVNKSLVQVLLQSNEFTVASCYRALHFTGNSSIRAALDWLQANQQDPEFDQFPLALPPPVFLCDVCTHHNSRNYDSYKALEDHVQSAHGRHPPHVVCSNRNCAVVVRASLFHLHVCN